MGAQCTSITCGKSPSASKEGIDKMLPLPTSYIGSPLEAMITYERRALGLSVEASPLPADGTPKRRDVACLNNSISAESCRACPYSAHMAPILLQDILYFWERDAVFRQSVSGSALQYPNVRDGAMILFQMEVSQKISHFFNNRKKGFLPALLRCRRQLMAHGQNCEKEMSRQKSNKTVEEMEGEERVFHNVFVEELIPQDEKRLKRGDFCVGTELYPLTLIVYFQRMPAPLLTIGFLEQVGALMEHHRSAPSMSSSRAEEESGDEVEPDAEPPSLVPMSFAEAFTTAAMTLLTGADAATPRQGPLQRPAPGTPAFALLLRLQSYCYLSDGLHRIVHRSPNVRLRPEKAMVILRTAVQQSRRLLSQPVAIPGIGAETPREVPLPLLELLLSEVMDKMEGGMLSSYLSLELNRCFTSFAGSPTASVARTPLPVVRFPVPIMEEEMSASGYGYTDASLSPSLSRTPESLQQLERPPAGATPTSKSGKSHKRKEKRHGHTGHSSRLSSGAVTPTTSLGRSSHHKHPRSRHRKHTHTSVSASSRTPSRAMVALNDATSQSPGREEDNAAAPIREEDSTEDDHPPPLPLPVSEELVKEPEAAVEVKVDDSSVSGSSVAEGKTLAKESGALQENDVMDAEGCAATQESSSAVTPMALRKDPLEGLCIPVPVTPPTSRGTTALTGATPPTVLLSSASSSTSFTPLPSILSMPKPLSTTMAALPPPPPIAAAAPLPEVEPVDETAISEATHNEEEEKREQHHAAEVAAVMQVAAQTSRNSREPVIQDHEKVPAINEKPVKAKPTSGRTEIERPMEGVMKPLQFSSSSSSSSSVSSSSLSDVEPPLSPTALVGLLTGATRKDSATPRTYSLGSGSVAVLSAIEVVPGKEKERKAKAATAGVRGGVSSMGSSTTTGPSAVGAVAAPASLASSATSLASASQPAKTAPTAPQGREPVPQLTVPSATSTTSPALKQTATDKNLSAGATTTATTSASASTTSQPASRVVSERLSSAEVVEPKVTKPSNSRSPSNSRNPSIDREPRHLPPQPLPVPVLPLHASEESSVSSRDVKKEDYTPKSKSKESPEVHGTPSVSKVSVAVGGSPPRTRPLPTLEWSPPVILSVLPPPPSRAVVTNTPVKHTSGTNTPVKRTTSISTSPPPLAAGAPAPAPRDDSRRSRSRSVATSSASSQTEPVAGIGAGLLSVSSIPMTNASRSASGMQQWGGTTPVGTAGPGALPPTQRTRRLGVDKAVGSPPPPAKRCATVPSDGDVVPKNRRAERDRDRRRHSPRETRRRRRSPLSSSTSSYDQSEESIGDEEMEDVIQVIRRPRNVGQSLSYGGMEVLAARSRGLRGEFTPHAARLYNEGAVRSSLAGRLGSAERYLAQTPKNRVLLDIPPSPSPPTPHYRDDTSGTMRALVAAKEIFMGVDHLPRHAETPSQDRVTPSPLRSSASVTPAKPIPSLRTPTPGLTPLRGDPYAAAGVPLSSTPLNSHIASSLTPLPFAMSRPMTALPTLASPLRPTGASAPAVAYADPMDLYGARQAKPTRTVTALPLPTVNPVDRVREQLEQLELPQTAEASTYSAAPQSLPYAGEVNASLRQRSPPSDANVELLLRMEQRIRELESDLSRTKEEKEIHSATMQTFVSRLDARCAMLEVEQHEQQATQSLLSMHVKDLEMQLDQSKDEELRYQVELTTAQRQVMRLRDAIEQK